MSVIVSCVTDVRDGLKPSQRRIIVAMNDLNLGKSKIQKMRKNFRRYSAIIIHTAEVVIYPTLVRMAQPSNLRCPLIDGQETLVIDGDPRFIRDTQKPRMTHEVWKCWMI